VSTAGSVDWLCLPRFDSPAAFAALLHNEEAGHWTLAPTAAGTCTTRRYAGNTLVLETDWVTADGAVRVIDFMPPRARTPHLIRIAVGLSGQVAMRSVLRLRFDYGRVVPWVRQDGPQVHAIAGPDLVRLVSAVPVSCHDWDTFADFTVRPGDRVAFVMSWAPGHDPQMEHADPEQALSATEEFWTQWAGHASYQTGPYRDAVDQSHHLEGPDPRADRRDRCGRDHVAAGGDRRGPQLGLPVLLAPRRHLHAAGPARGRVQARGRRVA
jgi:GH15 family glucan-1,4-alpha-glucosidase